MILVRPAFMGGYFRVLYFLRDSLGKEVVNMTDYEIISLVITLIGLLIGMITLLLKLFAFLDSRYKRK